MMDLTIDEKMLILLYSPGTRMGLYGALQQMKEQLEEDETELLDLTNSVLQKLSDMDDEVFEKLSLSLDLSSKAGFIDFLPPCSCNRVCPFSGQL